MSDESKQNPLELRKFASSRVSAKLLIDIQTPIQAKFQSLNVSQHGMLIQGGENLTIGNLVKFKTTLPPHKKTVSIVARVVRSSMSDNLCSAGLQFLEINTEAYIHWLEYVDKIEMMDSQRSERSATQMILAERKQNGYNLRKIMICFNNQEQAQQFVLEKIRDHKIFINLSTLKVPEDILILSFTILNQNKELQIKTKILKSEDASFKPDWAVTGLPLEILESEEDLRIKLNHFSA